MFGREISSVILECDPRLAIQDIVEGGDLSCSRRKNETLRKTDQSLHPPAAHRARRLPTWCPTLTILLHNANQL